MWMAPNPDLHSNGPLGVIEAKIILRDDAGPNRPLSNLAMLALLRLGPAFKEKIRSRVP